MKANRNDTHLNLTLDFNDCCLLRRGEELYAPMTYGWENKETTKTVVLKYDSGLEGQNSVINYIPEEVYGLDEKQKIDITISDFYLDQLVSQKFTIIRYGISSVDFYLEEDISSIEGPSGWSQPSLFK
ncbi:MAG: hypothetical protein ABIF08_03030 [Nanoarchaeota archaeon]